MKTHTICKLTRVSTLSWYIYNETRICAISNLRAMQPRAKDWKRTMISVNLWSRSSSRCASTPARKKILLWPIRKRLGSSSRASIYEPSINRVIHLYEPSINRVIHLYEPSIKQNTSPLRTTHQGEVYRQNNSSLVVKILSHTQCNSCVRSVSSSQI